VYRQTALLLTVELLCYEFTSYLRASPQAYLPAALKPSQEYKHAAHPSLLGGSSRTRCWSSHNQTYSQRHNDRR
jgi:hypothetical protein